MLLKRTGAQGFLACSERMKGCVTPAVSQAVTCAARTVPSSAMSSLERAGTGFPASPSCPSQAEAGFHLQASTLGSNSLLNSSLRDLKNKQPREGLTVYYIFF